MNRIAIALLMRFLRKNRLTRYEYEVCLAAVDVICSKTCKNHVMTYGED